MEKGTLYIVATPIGNLEDITFRAVRILKEVDLVAAEDTRHSRKLLTHFGISKPITSYFDHNKNFKGRYIIDKVFGGLSVALISDAGTPGISDPGYHLVRDAIAVGIKVVPIPGPSAFVAALSACGLDTESFVFEGFLPNRQAKRRAKITAVKDESRVTVFYESPKRLLAALTDMLEILGDRKIVVAREITKIHEEFARGMLSEVLNHFSPRPIQGEVLIIVSPVSQKEIPETGLVQDLLTKYLLHEKLSVKDAVRKVVLETGMKRSKIYHEALRVIDR